MTTRAGLTWNLITEKEYWRALECLPPAVMTGNGFLLGEPYDHVMVKGEERFFELPRYHAFVELNRKFFASSEPMTVLEFKAVTVADVLGVAA